PLERPSTAPKLPSGLELPGVLGRGRVSGKEEPHTVLVDLRRQLVHIDATDGRHLHSMAIQSEAAKRARPSHEVCRFVASLDHEARLEALLLFAWEARLDQLGSRVTRAHLAPGGKLVSRAAQSYHGGIERSPAVDPNVKPQVEKRSRFLPDCIWTPVGNGRTHHSGREARPVPLQQCKQVGGGPTAVQEQGKSRRLGQAQLELQEAQLRLLVAELQTVVVCAHLPDCDHLGAALCHQYLKLCQVSPGVRLKLPAPCRVAAHRALALTVSPGQVECLPTVLQAASCDGNYLAQTIGSGSLQDLLQVVDMLLQAVVNPAEHGICIGNADQVCPNVDETTPGCHDNRFFL
ncbi:unnamed protein product, partial [Ixodes hexagonus]